MSISSSIGRCLMVLMLAQGMVAHAADNVAINHHQPAA